MHHTIDEKFVFKDAKEHISIHTINKGHSLQKAKGFVWDKGQNFSQVRMYHLEDTAESFSKRISKSHVCIEYQLIWRDSRRIKKK